MTTPHPLIDTDSRPNRDDATAPEAADWLAHPEPEIHQPTQGELWDAEIARGEVWPKGKPAEPWPEEEEDTAE